MIMTGSLAAIRLIGNASTSMVISLLFAIYTMGIARKIPIKQVMDSCSTAITQIGMMLLIIGGGGAFKQVLINGGVGDYVAELFKGTAMSPILLAGDIAPHDPQTYDTDCIAHVVPAPSLKLFYTNRLNNTWESAFPAAKSAL